MATKEVVGNVITAVATAAVMGVVMWFVGVFNAGTTAADEALIEKVVNEMLMTETGANVKARINAVDGKLIGLETRAEALETEVNELERDVFCLAGGCQ